MTSFTRIYEAFLLKVGDPSFFDLVEYERERVLLGLLNDAQAGFERLCKYDLTNRNDDERAYAEDLGLEEISILALGMVCAWLSPKVNNATHLRNFLNTKDYTLAASPANMMRELSAHYASIKREYDEKIITYSYAYGGIENLSPR